MITDGASSATNHVVENAPSGSIIVEGKRADTLVRERRAPPRYVKTDVEGFEAKVIHGFRDPIGAVYVWFFEETGLAESRGLRAHAVTDLFLDHGFRGPYRVDSRARALRLNSPGMEDNISISDACLREVTRVLACTESG